MTTALIADDEDLPRAELRRMLATAWPDLQVVAECEHGPATLEALAAHAPEVAFLDIRMPGASGLEVARAASGRCHVVFTTAYDSHAIEAFEAGAVDYLLKPIREERLRESVRRAVADSEAATVEPDDTIAVELAGVTRFVSRSQVSHAEAQGDYVRLHTLDGGSHLIRTPLGSLAEEWADAGFLRIHRSIVVNRAHIVEVRMSSGRASVVVPGPGGSTTELQVARRHTRALRELIGERTP